MKYSPQFLLLLPMIGLLAVSQPALAATKKADQRIKALVTALQAVSPDPLGGHLGLVVATALAATPTPTKGERNFAQQSSRINPDQSAYLNWKNAQKS